jgi:hypothetical protein
MNDTTRLLLTVALVPITWVILSLYVFRPAEKLAVKHLPPRIAAFLVKKRFGG